MSAISEMPVLPPFKRLNFNAVDFQDVASKWRTDTSQSEISAIRSSLAKFTAADLLNVNAAHWQTLIAAGADEGIVDAVHAGWQQVFEAVGR